MINSGVVAHALVPEPWSQKRLISEFDVSLVYIASSRPVLYIRLPGETLSHDNKTQKPKTIILQMSNRNSKSKAYQSVCS